MITRPDGVCILTYYPDGRVHVDHADPRILISASILYGITDDASVWRIRRTQEVFHAGRSLSLTWPAPPPVIGRFAYNGAVLTIHGINQTVIYRIGDYVPHESCYIAEWPD